MEELVNKLSNFGAVRSINNNACQFSLLMTKTDKDLSNNSFKILELVTNYIGEEKKNIGTLLSDDSMLFLTLNP